MTLRRKLLVRIYTLTILIILAMSGTYYYIFTKDIRERSQQSVSTTFNLILDDLSTRVATVSSKIDQFVEGSLSSPIYTIQMLQSQQDTSDRDAVLWNIKRSMTYFHLLTTKMREFGGLVGATEIHVYGSQRNLLAMYQQEGEKAETAVFFPTTHPKMMVPIAPDDRWFAMIQSLEELPLRPAPEKLPLEFQGDFPQEPTVVMSRLRDLMTIQFSVPIEERGELQGVCVLHVAIQQQDVIRYSRLSGTEVNVFTGSALSVGTLPEYNFLPEEFTTQRTQLDSKTLSDMSQRDFSNMSVQGYSYYQGTLAFGDKQNLLGAITVHFPRALEEKQKANFLMVVVVVTLVFGLVVAAEALGLSSAIVLPIVHLMNTMQEVKYGNLDVEAQVESDDEIGKLADTFNTMAAQLKSSFMKIEQQTHSLERQNAELKQLDKLKDEFLSNTSHELRTPLNGIAGLADALLSGADGSLNEQASKHIHMILQSSKRLTNLVTALLDFSKARSKTLRLHRRTFPIEEVVNVVCDFLRPQFEKKGLELQIDIPEELPEVYADIDKVEQILTNFIGNAIKFTHEGVIGVSARQDGAFLSISVRDSGIGIPQEARERIFRPFEQADGSSTREFGGTGLGLSISKELVELHGGRTWVESEPDQGSDFFFTLPCQPEQLEDTSRRHNKSPRPNKAIATSPAEADTLTITSDAAQEVKEISGKGRRVLVIDDDKTNLEVLRTHLENVNFEVIQASNGEEAFEIINGNTVDIILCDVMMPLMDGYTFAMRKRDHHSLKEIPLVFISAKDQQEDIVRGYQAGALDYLSKPINSEELLLKVNAVINYAERYRRKEHTPEIIGLHDTVYDTDQDKDLEYLKPRKGHGEHILVVDDDPINLEVLETHLTSYKYTVSTASDGFEALEAIETAPPDLLLLDVMMPKLSGFKLSKILRVEKGIKDLPIIMVTAKSHIDDKVYGMNIGAGDYVIKPFHKDELLTRIWIQLQIKTLQKELLHTNVELQTEIAERKQVERALRDLNANLESRVEERTIELEASLNELRRTQEHLVQSEKMAALGMLVAGIAHEINTPIGVGVTAASHLEHKTEEFIECYQRDEMTRSALDKYLQLTSESSSMILKNLQRAAEQVQNFKQIAVDQSREEQRSFLVRNYLEETIFSLQPQLQQSRHAIEIHGDENVAIYSYPGAFSQIISSFIMNSVMHAYPDPKERGRLQIHFEQDQDFLFLEYSDDGCGIQPDSLDKVFEPFFTTARGRGGSGLGLHIVYNTVVRQLKGRIFCESEPGQGTRFTVRVPLKPEGMPGEKVRKEKEQENV